MEIPGLRLSDASRVRFIKVDCQTATGITWLYLAMASWNIDLCGWSEDDYSGLLAGEEALKGVRLFHPLFFHVWFNLGMRLFSFVVVVVFLLCLCFWFLLFVSHS